MSYYCLIPDTNVNVLTWDHKTAFDIADGMPLLEESPDKATTTWESGSKYLNNNYIYKMLFIYIYSDGVMPHQ